MNTIMHGTPSPSTLFILCGEAEYPLDGLAEIVTWCPIRHQVLKRQGIDTHLFGDFGPREDQGRELDLQLHNDVDRALHDESATNEVLTWVPLAIGQVKWRLLRYRWLKLCLSSIVEQFHPERIVLSSDQDKDMVLAMQTIAGLFRIAYRIDGGPFDPPTNIMHLLAPYGLPATMDPLWITRVVALLLKCLHKNARILYEPYGNLKDGFCRADALMFPAARYLNIRQAFLRKLLRVRHMEACEPDPPISKTHPMLIHEHMWSHFSQDERVVINSALTHFIERLPPHKVAQILKALAVLFTILKPRRIVLASDLVSLCRLLAYAAHEAGVPVDFLPHGIAWEDCSGTRRPSPFVPDRLLAWSHASKRVYERLGWKALAVAHSVNQGERVPLRRLSQKWNKARVIVLVPEWCGVSLGGREDIMVASCVKIYKGLTDLGVLSQHIYLKSHHTAFAHTDAIRKDPLLRLQKEVGFGFSLLSSAQKSITLLPQFDLAIMGITTGIYEAALTGTPVVLFGNSSQRVGTLEGIALPYATSAQQLEEAVRNYDNVAVEKMYTELIHRLQSGISLEKI